MSKKQTRVKYSVQATTVQESDLLKGFDPLLGGSIKHKVVNPALQEERDKCIFD